VLVSLRAMVSDLLADELIINRRLPYTLFLLFFRPGFLTMEHVNGRIVRYVRPFKMYLVSSVIFFLLLSLFSVRALEESLGRGDVEGSAEVVPGAELAAIDSALAEITGIAADPATPVATRRVLERTRRTLERQRIAALVTTTNEGGDGPASTSVRHPGRTTTVAEYFDLPTDTAAISVTTGYAAVDGILRRRIAELVQLTPRQAAERLVGDFLGYIPTVMFILLPVFALVLKLLYLRRRRFYAEHFVFLLHVHAFVYLIFTVMLLMRGFLTLPWGLVLAFFAWTAMYIYLAMRRVYGQGRVVTFAKYWLLGLSYIAILGISVPFALLLSLLF